MGNLTCKYLLSGSRIQTANLRTRYMAGYKCNVTGSTSSKKVAPAQVAAYCEDDSTECVKGAKQMIAFNRTIFDPLIVILFFFIPLTELSRKNRK